MVDLVFRRSASLPGLLPDFSVFVVIWCDRFLASAGRFVCIVSFLASRLVADRFVSIVSRLTGMMKACDWYLRGAAGAQFSAENVHRDLVLLDIASRNPITNHAEGPLNLTYL